MKKYFFLLLQLFLIFSCNNGEDLKGLLDIELDSNGNVYLATNYGLFFSSNKGSSWVKLNDEKGRFLYFDSLNNDLYYSGDFGLKKSNDNGKNFISLKFPDSLLNPDISIVTVDPAGRIFVGAYFGVCTKNTKANSWNFIGLRDFGIQNIYIDKQKNIYVGTFHKGLYMAKESSLKWKEAKVPKHWITGIQSNGSGKIFISTSKNYIFSSNDHGKTWKQLKNGLDDYFITALGISPGNRIFIGDNFTVYFSDDSGETWTISNKYLDVMVLKFVFDATGTIYALPLDSHLIRSDDNGVSWVELKNPLEQIAN